MCCKCTKDCELSIRTVDKAGETFHSRSDRREEMKKIWIKFVSRTGAGEENCGIAQMVSEPNDPRQDAEQPEYRRK